MEEIDISEEGRGADNKKFYDSKDAYAFLLNAWEGTDDHVGVYTKDNSSIAEASVEVTKMMLKRLPKLRKSSKILDVGAGFGSTARFIVKNHECYVTCLNISEKQNAYSQAELEKEEMDKKLTVVQGDFEGINFDRESFDMAWSQDAFYLSDKKDTVFYQVSRLLNPGGRFIFTDIMKGDEVKDEELESLLEIVDVPPLASVEYYKRLASRVDFERVSIKQMPDQLLTHFEKLIAKVTADYDTLAKSVSKGFIDKQLTKYEAWKSAAESGLLNWGILQFQKRNI